MRKVINGYEHIPYKPQDITEEASFRRSLDFYKLLESRRSIRDFSDKPVDRRVIDTIIMSAGTAPSGANKQPWSFCAISDPEIKKEIREAAEAEEKKNYEKRMGESWLKDLEPFATNWEKPFLEIAPWIIVVFKRTYEFGESNSQVKNYYVNESVGIACGMLIAAIHYAGLVTLTHTPSPMNFLTRILNRKENEKPFLLLPVGYPNQGTFVPDISRKPKEEILFYYDHKLSNS